jgi:hypothetical protein
MRDRSCQLGADQIILWRRADTNTLSQAGWRPPLIVVQRHEESDAVRAYVLELASVTRKLFGTTMRKTIATTASVALQATVTERQVRHWVS